MTSPAPTHSLRELAEGVWLDRAPVRFLGLQLTAETTVIRLDDGGLVVHAPGPLTDERRRAILSLGRVEHLYAPNLFHHLYIEAWAAAFPEARVHAPDALRAKHPQLRIDRPLGGSREPAFDGVLEEIPIEGCRLGETVLIHHPSRTLVVTDLVANIGRPSHWWTVAYTRGAGFYDRVALSRVVRWTAFNDKPAARASVERILAADFERLVVGHGEPLLEDAREQLREANSWLLRS